MWNYRRTVFLLVVMVAVGTGTGCLVPVTDALNIAKNTATAVLKEQLVNVLNEERRQLRRMAQRLSALTDLVKYALPNAPRWRHHSSDGERFLFANPFTAALNSGDPTGRGYTDVTLARTVPGPELTTLRTAAPHAYAALVASLATLDAADSTLIAGLDQTGRLRATGKREVAAVDALDTDVIDPSAAQSATAVLEKMNGAGLIEARQEHARVEYLTAIVEQLLVENKRDRDTEVAAMNMQLGALLHGRQANAALVTGAGEDLRRWRQP